MAEKPGRVAIAAFVVSACPLALSAFQLWQGHREDRIKAAIEISMAYLQDADMERHRKIVEEMLPKQVIGGRFYSPDQLIEVTRYFRRLDYLALLLNTRRVHPSYIAETMKCDIIRARFSLAGNKPEFTEEIRAFGKNKGLCQRDVLPPTP